jgi:hypothetical protein
MRKKAVCILKCLLLLVMLLKLPILFDASPKDFLLFYAIETSETEAENAEEDTGEEDEFVRLTIYCTCHNSISSAVHRYPASENKDAHIREIVPPPPQG